MRKKNTADYTQKIAFSNISVLRFFAGRTIRPLVAAFLGFIISLSPSFAAFVHPGIYHNAADLAFMRQKIAAKAEPWYSAWQELQGEWSSKLNWTPHPVADWDANKNAYMQGDAVAAYSHALQWALTGNPANAAKAIEILNAWSATLQHLHGTTSQEMVVWGWNGYHLVNAAELLRFYVPPGGKPSGWAPVDIERFKKMLALGYDVIKDFKPAFNGNWDASMMNTMLCTAIFTDDQAMFNRVIDHFHGKYDIVIKGKSVRVPKYGAWGNLTNYIFPTGQCEETGRDQGHVQMGLGNYAALCEAAWKQGVDLYSTENNRLLLGIEYKAKFMLGHDDIPYTNTEPKLPWGPKPSQGERDRIAGIYESVYQHYVNRKGLEMPFTKQIILGSTTPAGKPPRPHRPEGSTPNAGICWGTLTMFKGPEKPQPAKP